MSRPMTSGVSAVSGFVANGHQTLHHVSCSPSKIPYGGFSPVRLQTGIRRRPSPHRGLYAAKAAVSGACSSFEHFGGPLLPRPSRPEALGSPAGYAVPPGLRLLWPHPSLSSSPTGLSSSSDRVFRSREGPHFPLRVCPIVPPPGPRRTGRLHGCSSAVRGSLRLFRTGSASAFPRSSVPAWPCNEADSGSLALRPDGLLALHRPGRLLSSLHLLSRLKKASSMTMRRTANCRSRTSTGKTRSPVGCERNTRNIRKTQAILGKGDSPKRKEGRPVENLLFPCLPCIPWSQMLFQG